MFTLLLFLLFCASPHTLLLPLLNFFLLPRHLRRALSKPLSVILTRALLPVREPQSIAQRVFALLTPEIRDWKMAQML